MTGVTRKGALQLTVAAAAATGAGILVENYFHPIQKAKRAIDNLLTDPLYLIYSQLEDQKTQIGTWYPLCGKEGLATLDSAIENISLAGKRLFFTEVNFAGTSRQLSALDLKTFEKTDVTTDPAKWLDSYSISPDGKKIIYNYTSFEMVDGGFDFREPEFYIADLKGAKISNPERIMPNIGFHAYDLNWSPDMKYLSFQSLTLKENGEPDPAGGIEIYLLNVKTGELKSVFSPGYQTETTWSPDSRQIALSCALFPSGSDIFKVNIDDSSYKRIAHTGHGWSPKWSPDCSRIAFFSTKDSPPRANYSGEVYVVDQDGRNEKRITYLNPLFSEEAQPANQVHTLGSMEWSPDGKDIGFVANFGANIKAQWMPNYSAGAGKIMLINPDTMNLREIAEFAFREPKTPDWNQINFKWIP